LLLLDLNVNLFFRFSFCLVHLVFHILTTKILLAKNTYCVTYYETLNPTKHQVTTRISYCLH
jgi:hypothetical protein